MSRGDNVKKGKAIIGRISDAADLQMEALP
jgi:hypothetical protein